MERKMHYYCKRIIAQIHALRRLEEVEVRGILECRTLTLRHKV